MLITPGSQRVNDFGFNFQAELVALRHDLVEEKAAKQVLEKEVNNLLLQLHAVQLQLHSNSGVPLDSENIKNKLVSFRMYICKVVLSFIISWKCFQVLATK